MSSMSVSRRRPTVALILAVFAAAGSLIADAFDYDLGARSPAATTTNWAVTDVAVTTESLSVGHGGEEPSERQEPPAALSGPRPHFYDPISNPARTNARLDDDRSAPQMADDWWRASNVGRNRAGTLVPESFDLSVAGQKFAVHPNATKHMAEYATAHGGGSVPISSLAGSVDTAVRGGLQSGRNFVRVGPWELGIDTRGNVIYHAVYRP